jgi:hypothetical protein
MAPETKRWLWIALAGVVLCAASFSAGAFLGPKRVETMEKIVYRDLTMEDLTKGMTFTKTVNKTIYRNVVTEVTDAGTKTTDLTTEVIGSHEDKNSSETTRKLVDKGGESEKLKTVTAQPRWAVGVFVGASTIKPQLVITGPLVVGAEVDYRVVGGVSLGLRGNTAGTFGLTGKLEF